MCITAERIQWLLEIRGLGYDVIWADAYFAVK